MAQREKDQQLQRSTKIFEDQHGREWVVTLHNANMMPVGEKYLRQCRPPIPTPSKYVNVVPNRLGKLHIDYDNWIRDIGASNLWRRERMQQIAEKSYGTAFAAVLKDPPGELLAKLGSSPIPVEFVYAMKSGESKWALGIRKADGSYYPRPKWVTDDLWSQAQAALKQSWSSADAQGGAIETFASGTFSDEEELVAVVADEGSPFADDEEDAEPVFVKTMDAPGTRRPGRPRKSA